MWSLNSSKPKCKRADLRAIRAQWTRLLWSYKLSPVRKKRGSHDNTAWARSLIEKVKEPHGPRCKIRDAYRFRDHAESDWSGTREMRESPSPRINYRDWINASSRFHFSHYSQRRGQDKCPLNPESRLLGLRDIYIVPSDRMKMYTGHKTAAFDAQVCFRLQK